MKKAIDAIHKNGILLVYPLDNRKEPHSIWSALYPKSKMKWDWNEDSDDRVAKLWHLREELSRCNQVVYSKWYQGRATFFSREIFTNLLAALQSSQWVSQNSVSRQILELLESDSPLSTKQLKEMTELQGKLNEPLFNKAMKPLWQKLLLVGYGEIEDSSFPSLAIGASKTIFEDLWNQSQEIDPQRAEACIKKTLGEKNKFFQFYLKMKQSNS